jgi:hypothetical protein
LAAATRDDVAAVAAAYLAPAKAVTVVLGDADRVAAPLATLSTLEQIAAPSDTSVLEEPADELPPPPIAPAGGSAPEPGSPGG